MIIELQRDSRDAKLIINEKKTFLLTNTKQTEIVLNHNKLNLVNEVIYLGELIGCEENKNEIERRITLSLWMYWALKYIVKIKHKVKCWIGIQMLVML